MTTTLKVKTREFKDILKVFHKFAQFSHKKASITITYDPVQLVMITDHAFITATPRETIFEGDDSDYCFNPEVLLGLTLRGEDVELSWDGDGSLLNLVNNNLKTSLRVAVPHPNYQALPSPEEFNCEAIPLGVLAAITKFLSIPFSFDNRKKELMPVRLRKGDDGFLVASADDGFSLAKITTTVPIKSALDVKIPKYILDCLYMKGTITDDTLIPVGLLGSKSLLSNGTIQIYSAGMTDESSDFDRVLYDFKPKTSFAFKPKTLSEAIKPLVDLIPKTERSATVLKVAVADKVSMSVKHKDIGEGDVDEIADVDNIYNEEAVRKASVMMHPQSFQDYTNLFTVEKGNLYANKNMVHYQGAIDSGGSTLKINYIFPTVQV